MNTDTTGDSPIDRALAAVARDVEPTRDLWPAIAAQIGVDRAPRRWLPLAAAAMLLAAASSLVTLVVVRRPESGIAATREAPTVTRTPSVQPATFGPGHALSPEYAAARTQLAAMLQARIGRLPTSARTKLEENLGQLRRATEEINSALALQPGDPLLEELLLSTYQEELAVLASVNDLTNLNGAAAPDEDEGIKL